MATRVNITVAQLLALRKKERKRLDECREKDFAKGRVTHSAATDDALSRMLMVDELLDELEGADA